MSFDYNPFKHIEIVEQPTGGYSWHCHGCGADSHVNRAHRPAGTIRTGTLYGKHTPLIEVFDSFRSHIRISHGRTEDDFSDWSIY